MNTIRHTAMSASLGRLALAPAMEFTWVDTPWFVGYIPLPARAVPFSAVLNVHVVQVESIRTHGVVARTVHPACALEVVDNLAALDRAVLSPVNVNDLTPPSGADSVGRAIFDWWEAGTCMPESLISMVSKYVDRTRDARLIRPLASIRGALWSLLEAHTLSIGAVPGTRELIVRKHNTETFENE